MLPSINVVGRNVSFGAVEHHDYASSSCAASAGSSKLPTISESSFNSLVLSRSNRLKQAPKLKQTNIQLPLWAECKKPDSSAIGASISSKRSPSKATELPSRFAVQPTEMHLDYNRGDNRHLYTLPVSGKDRLKTPRISSSRPSTQQLQLPSTYDLNPTELSSLKPHNKIHRKRKKEKKTSSPVELQHIEGSLHLKTGGKSVNIKDRYELPSLGLDVVTSLQSSKDKSTSPVVVPQLLLEDVSDGKSTEQSSPSWPETPQMGPSLMYKVVITNTEVTPTESPKRQNTQEMMKSPPSKKQGLENRTVSKPYIAHKLNLYAHNQISTYARKKRELAEKRKREATQRQIIRPKFFRSKTQIPKSNKSIMDKKPKTPLPLMPERIPTPVREDKTPSPDPDLVSITPYVTEYYPLEMDVVTPAPEEEDADRMEVETVVDNYSTLSVSPTPLIHRPKTPKLLKVDKGFLSSIADHDTLSKTFKKLDTNGDGHLSFPEVKSTFPPDLNPNQIAYIKKMYDLACESTFFGLEEFIGVTCFCKMASRSPISHSFKTIQPSQVDSLLRTYIELFADIDRKSKGVIPASSIKEILSSAMNSRCASATVGRILKEMHKGPDDSINGVEFLVYIPYFASQLSR